MEWIETIPENLRDKIKDWLKRAIEMSDIYERNRGYGNPGSSQGYLNSKIALTDKIEGFCTALFLMGILEYPVFVSVNNSIAEVSQYSKDFTISGNPVKVAQFREEDL